MENTLIAILQFLTDHKTIIIGAALTIAELIVIVVNLIRRIKNLFNENAKNMVETLSVDSNTMNFSDFIKPQHKSIWHLLTWSANPLNLFKK